RRSILGVSITPPKLPIWPKPRSSIIHTSTLGAPSRTVGLARGAGFDSANVLPITASSAPAVAGEPTNANSSQAHARKVISLSPRSETEADGDSQRARFTVGLLGGTLHHQYLGQVLLVGGVVEMQR